jgi:outer membrane protein TolC
MTRIEGSPWFGEWASRVSDKMREAKRSETKVMSKYKAMEDAAKEVDAARVDYEAARQRLAAAQEDFDAKKRRLREASDKWAAESDKHAPKTYNYEDRDP